MVLMNSKKYVLDNQVLEDLGNNPEYGLKVHKILDPINNFLYVTSETKYKVEKRGYIFSEILAMAQKHISGKIHYIELSNTDRENAVFLKRGLKKFHRSDDVIFAYCVTNNYVMASPDIDLKETCEKVGCKLELIN